MRPKRFAKVLLGQALVRGGLWKRRLRTWADRNSVIILTYHRVTEPWDETLDHSQPGMVVTGSTFERQLAILKEHFEVVTLGALLKNGVTAVLRQPSSLRRISSVQTVPSGTPSSSICSPVRRCRVR